MIFLMLSNRLTNQIQHFSIDRTPLKFSKTFQFSVRLRINPKTKMFIFFHMASSPFDKYKISSCYEYILSTKHGKMV